MRDYWLTQYGLSAIGWGYLLLVIVAIALAAWLPKGRTAKGIGLAIVLGLASILPIKTYQQFLEQQAVADERKQRYAKAKALFEERCRTGGETIFKTVEGVEGIRLLTVRSGDLANNRANPNWPDAGLPYEPTANGYIMTFLLWENHDDKRTPRGYLTTNRSSQPGYRYVDAMFPDAIWMRYELDGNNKLVSRTVPESELARYGISHMPAGQVEDRQSWVAGISIQVVDTQTNEVLARRESYAFEPGLGDTSGFRQPWGFAITCPKHEGWRGGQTRFFVDQVLKPNGGK